MRPELTDQIILLTGGGRAQGRSPFDLRSEPGITAITSNLKRRENMESKFQLGAPRSMIIMIVSEGEFIKQITEFVSGDEESGREEWT